MCVWLRWPVSVRVLLVTEQGSAPVFRWLCLSGRSQGSKVVTLRTRGLYFHMRPCWGGWGPTEVTYQSLYSVCICLSLSHTHTTFACFNACWTFKAVSRDDSGLDCFGLAALSVICTYWGHWRVKAFCLRKLSTLSSNPQCLPKTTARKMTGWNGYGCIKDNFFFLLSDLAKCFLFCLLCGFSSKNLGVKQ